MTMHDLLIIGALALGGCASSQTSPPPAPTAATTPAAGAPHDMAAMCPMAVEGTTARAENTETGAAMVFTTTGDVAELRARVARMAAMHASHHGAGPGAGMCTHCKHGPGAGGPPAAHPHGPGHPPGQGGMMGAGMMKMPPAAARSEDIEGGARIVLTPQDPTQVAALQQHAQQMAAKMASGQCPMMAMQGGAHAAPSAAPHQH